jgi:methenyltetrahydrofolate cyclohydrolase
MRASRPFDELLEELADRTPAPGGGTAAGWTLALAAGLVEMSARFADRDRVAARAAELRARALELAEEELHAYEPVLEAKRTVGDVASALSAAAEPPLAIARAAVEVAELGAEVVRDGKESLRGDALTGVILAAAACTAAAGLAGINLTAHTEDPRLLEAVDLSARVAEVREEALEA